MPKLQDYVWDEFKTWVIEQILAKARSATIAGKREIEKVKMDSSSEDFNERIRELMRDWEETINVLEEPSVELDDFSKHIRKLLKRGVRRAIGSLDFSKLFRIKEKKETK